MTTHDLAAVYVLDGLDEAERQEFEAHLATCGPCQEEVRVLRNTAVPTLAELAAVPVPDGLRNRVLGQIALTPQVAAPARPTDIPVGPPRGSAPAGGAPAEGAAVVSLAAHRARRRPPRLLSVAAALVLVVAGALAALSLRGGGTTADSAADIFTAADARTVALQGAGGTITVAWSPDRGRLAVTADGLPAPGPGQRYELWRIDGGAPAPAGLFAPGSDGRVSQVAPFDGTVQAWGVTLEPDTGSPAPTGPILYQGTA